MTGKETTTDKRESNPPKMSKGEILGSIVFVLALLLIPRGIQLIQNAHYEEFFFSGEKIEISMAIEEGEVNVITNKEEVEAAARILSDWDMRAASVPPKEKKDLACPIRISFEEGTTIYLAEAGNYGRIEGDAHDYYFPEEFVNWVRRH